MNNHNIKITTEQCFGICQGFFFIERIKHGFEDVEADFDSKIEEFSKLLIKTDLEEYTNFLLASELLHIFHRPKISAEEFVSIGNKEEIELSKILHYFLSNTNDDLTVVIKRGQLKDDNYKTDNEFITSTIIDGLKAKYRSHGYNERHLTIEETKSKFLNFRNDDALKGFIIDWCINNEHIAKLKMREEDPIVTKARELFYSSLSDPFDSSKSQYEFQKEWDEYSVLMKVEKKIIEQSIDKEEVYNRVENGLLDLQNEEYADVFELIEHYQGSFIVKEEITLEWLENRMKYLGIIKAKKAGAKPKNDLLASKAEHFSYLIRLRRFINQDEYDDIEKFPISNADCRLIYDCFVFLGHIEDNIGKNNSTKPENYIRSLIDNYRANRKELELRSYYTKAAERSINHLQKTGEILKL